MDKQEMSNYCIETCGSLCCREFEVAAREMLEANR